MTTTKAHGDDQFGFWSTDVLIGICFRVTPRGELAHWVVTSAERFDEEGQELYTRDQLRDFAVEQLECQGIDIHAVNQMKS
jgi:hypothetical protein